MISAAQSFMNEGMELGFKKGLSQGASQTQKEIIQKMFEQGIALDIIL